MFLNTLAILDKVIHVACTKLENSVVHAPNNRGVHKNEPNALSTELQNSICKLVDGFPIIQLHYTRKATNKQYLNSDFII